MNCSEEEWNLRVKLAACYRLVHLYGMTDLISTHISLRLPTSISGKEEQFLINPYGLFFDEITASSLIKIDMGGNVLSETDHPVNRAGFVIHGAIHEAREDVACILHTHTRAGVAISAQKNGLLPISQQASLVLGSLAYHDYEGIAVYEEERERLQKDLGDSQYFILKNHGLLTAANSVEEAFWSMYILETACQIQIAAQSGGGDLTFIEPEVLQGVDEAVNNMKTVHPAFLAWPGLMRKLEKIDASFKL